MDEKLEKINFLGQYLAGSRSEEQILEMAMLISKDVLGYDHAIIRLLEGGVLVSRNFYGFPRDAADMVIEVGEGITGEAVKSGKAVLVNDTTADPRFLAGVEDCRSELCVPLIYNEKPLGAINVESDEPGFFKASDINLLETLASQIAAALETRDLVGKLQQAEKLSVVGQMASSILHDIRNDIHQLYICSDLIRRPEHDEVTNGQLADLVKKSGNNIYSLIEDIFEFVKTGETKLKTREENLALHLYAIVEEMRMRTPDKISFELDADPSIEILADQRRFARVMQNLLNNAAEAMPDGGKIFLSAKRDKKGKALITVSDAGCGIPKERIAKIWEPLYTYGKKEGTGLGMAIIKKIIEEHGWVINVTSEPDKGTVFTITTG